MRVLHDLQQGSDAWHEFRLHHHGASEAAAMLGLSKRVTRLELLRAKHTGIAREFSEFVQTRILDKGHEVEATARPHVEALIGDDLYPLTYSLDALSASLDGMTLGGEIAMEHKQWAESLALSVANGIVPPEHMPQCQQALMVSGSKRLIFVVSDGTPERMVHTWVEPDPQWFQRIRDGWAQFDKDLAAYTLPDAKPEPARAEPMESLPAVSVRLDGALSVVGNLPTFAVALRDYIAKIPQRPTTDTEFATAEAACKALRKAEEALDAAEAGALASITDVDAMRRAVADCRQMARNTRLATEKLVERRKLEIKEQAVMTARGALDRHIADLNGELAPMRLQPVPVDFAGAIKGLRSFDSMQAALDAALANAKIAADGQARGIRKNIDHFKDVATGLEGLFADLHQLVHKAPEDFRTAVQSRVLAQQERDRKAEEARKAAEAARIADAERRAAAEAEARVRAEQEAKAAADLAAQRVESERLEKLAEANRQALQREQAAVVVPTPASAPVAAPVATLTVQQVLRDVAPTVIVEAMAPRADEPATLKLGVIGERLGFTVSAAFLADVLHTAPAGRAGASALYRESQWPVICRQLIAHVGAMAELYAAEQAAA